MEVDRDDAETLVLAGNADLERILDHSRGRARREGWLSTGQVRKELGTERRSILFTLFIASLFILLIASVILLGALAANFPAASGVLNGVALCGVVGALFGGAYGIAKYGMLPEGQHKKCAAIGGFIGMAIGLPLVSFYDLGIAPLLAMGIGAAAVIVATLIAAFRRG